MLKLFRTSAAGIALAAACFAAVGATGAAAAAEVFRPLPPDSGNLDQYRWNKRVVMIFAPSPQDPKYRDVTEALRARAAGLENRDLVVLTDTDPKAQGRLRAAFDVRGFRMLLVGKDGGVKLDEGAVISPDMLFQTIDAMPMRRDEMRKG
ncbi:DUF4174 domain-containing protein [Acidimangrovimonas sediminis]|uniref:DUF4174 domain-containing protein n=1 Tax=Acidimangrovimonas sediminis TaxID=2056283 RepID=UPI000C8073FC|nr:DUF4174 domain-containing protein [Acidimangrovimonas sediminis]